MRAPGLGGCQGGAQRDGLGRILYMPLSGAGDSQAASVQLRAAPPSRTEQLLCFLSSLGFSALPIPPTSFPHLTCLPPQLQPQAWLALVKRYEQPAPFSAQRFRGNLERAASWGLSFAALKKQQVSGCVLCRPKYNLTVLARPPCLREKAAWLVT